MSEEATKRCAVVTGANKGVGFGICKVLASKGVMVVLTARDEKRGLDAVEKLKEYGFSNNVVFHQLDVADPQSVASLADFLKTQFGKLDILVNNAGVLGVIMDGEALQAAGISMEVPVEWDKYTTQIYELAEECLDINYYGTTRVSEALIPLLELSDAPRIVNITSFMGRLKIMKNEWARGVLRDIDNLTEEKIDEVLSRFLKDFKEGSIESRGWPRHLSAHTMSKVAMNAYTKILAKMYPSFRINSVCPGFVKTDINYNTGNLTLEEGAETPVHLALLPNGGPSGRFYIRSEESTFE